LGNEGGKGEDEKAKSPGKIFLRKKKIFKRFPKNHKKIPKF